MTGLKIGIVKPDYGVTGGFELHVNALLSGLAERGHSVKLVGVDATVRPPSVYGYPVTPVFREWHDEYFRYLELAERTQQLDLQAFDVVCATQPPTYLADHNRMFALTYHHYRVFYDLADEFVAAGFVDAHAHAQACAAIRLIDQDALPRIRSFLAGSNTVAQRLQRFWNVGSIDYRHPNVTDLPPASDRDPASSEILCVSRQEWPKRTELFVAALHLTAAQRSGNRPIGHLVGGGSREDFVTSLDAELAAKPNELQRIQGDGAGEIWRNMGIFSKGWRPFDGPQSGRIQFHGRVSDDERNELYAASAVVVAPALDEDYGLTVLEAWHQQRPVIVCSDGGGLTELVQHGQNGLIAEPTPFAIAQAIDRLCNDPELAASLVAAGSDSLAEIRWSNALDTFEAVALTTAGHGSDNYADSRSSTLHQTPVRPAELTAYATGGFHAVEGWLSPASAHSIQHLSEAQMTGGGVAEIGVHHGQLFILLALLCGPDEVAVGFDLFERQDENVDGSGKGDRDHLNRNLIAAGVPEEAVVLVLQNSMNLQPADVLGLTRGPVRLFSVDGGHAAEITMNDLWIADRVLTDDGILILDDAFNTMWPGVGEGMHNYLRHPQCELIPFGIVANKTLFTKSEAAAARYRAVLAQHPYEDHLIREDQLLGSAVLCSKYAPGH